MYTKFISALVLLLAFGCVETPPSASTATDGGSTSGLDSGLPNPDADLSDAEAPGDATADDDADAGDDTGEGGDEQVTLFDVSQPSFRIGLDAVDVGGTFIIENAAGDEIECPGGVEGNPPVGETLESARVSGSTFTFTAGQPGRTTLRYECQEFTTSVEVTVLPAPHDETTKLAAWLRPDIGVTVGISDEVEEIENLVTGNSYEAAFPQPARVEDGGLDVIRLRGDSRLETREPITVGSGHVVLVYRSAGTAGANEPVIGSVDRETNLNEIRVPARNGEGVGFASGRFGSPRVNFEWPESGWSHDERNVYFFTIRTRMAMSSVAVDLAVNGSGHPMMTEAVTLTGPNTFQASIIGGAGSVGANGFLYEVIVYDVPLSANGRDLVARYLSERYP